MKKYKKVSIVVPVYNTAVYIEKCLHSISNQSYKNLEILLINDGSSDDSLAICERFASRDERIKIISRANKGVSKTRNEGISAATGDYVTFVDSDDWVDGDAIENMVTCIETYDVDAVRASYAINYSGQEAVAAHEVYREGKYDSPPELRSLTQDFLKGKMNCYTVLLMIKRGSLGNIRFDEKISMMEDVIFYVDLLGSIKSIYLTKLKTYHYRQNNLGASKNPDNFLRNMKSIIRVSTRIKKIMINDLDFTGDDYRRIAAIHISLIVSRLVSYVRQGVTIIEFRDQLISMNADQDFVRLFRESNISTLPLHLRLTVNAARRGHIASLWLIIQARLSASKLRAMWAGLIRSRKNV